MEEKTRDFRYGRLPLPVVGKSDWEEVAGHCYCVDKTLLMRDLLATRAGVAGHHSVICKPGTDEWYICYHRRPIPSEGRNHRVVCIDRMEFDANGEIKPVVMTE